MSQLSNLTRTNKAVVVLTTACNPGICPADVTWYRTRLEDYFEQWALGASNVPFNPEQELKWKLHELQSSLDNVPEDPFIKALAEQDDVFVTSAYHDRILYSTAD